MAARRLVDDLHHLSSLMSALRSGACPSRRRRRLDAGMAKNGGDNISKYRHVISKPISLDVYLVDDYSAGSMKEITKIDFRLFDRNQILSRDRAVDNGLFEF